MSRTAPFLRAAAGGAVPLLLLGAWYAGSATGGIGAQTLPPPAEVAATLLAIMRSGELFQALAVSLWRVAVGFTLGAAAGLALGAAMGLSPRVEAYLFPTFKLLTYIPLIAWVPLAMLVVGIGEWLKFLLIAKAALVPMALNSFRGIRAVPAGYRDLAAVFGLSRRQYLTHLLLPAAVPAVWTGLRYALTYSWLVLVVVELIASTEGLGFLMINAQQLYQLDALVASVLVIGSVGFILDRGLAAAEKRLLRWRPENFK